MNIIGTRLIQVSSIDRRAGTITFTVPSNPGFEVTLPEHQIRPPEVYRDILAGKEGVLSAGVNLDAKSPEGLMPHDFEIYPSGSPERPRL